MPSSRIQVGVNSLGWEVFPYHHPVVDDQPAIPIHGALQNSILFHNLHVLWFGSKMFQTSKLLGLCQLVLAILQCSPNMDAFFWHFHYNAFSVACWNDS